MGSKQQLPRLCQSLSHQLHTLECSRPLCSPPSSHCEYIGRGVVEVRVQWETSHQITKTRSHQKPYCLRLLCKVIHIVSVNTETMLAKPSFLDETFSERKKNIAVLPSQCWFDCFVTATRLFLAQNHFIEQTWRKLFFGSLLALNNRTALPPSNTSQVSSVAMFLSSPEFLFKIFNFPDAVRKKIQWNIHLIMSAHRCLS